MRIDEVDIVDDNILRKGPEGKGWKTPQEVAKWLRKRGYQKKGEGHFAEAYMKPSHNRIVKISTRRDRCWVKFAKRMLQKTTVNPYLPDIHWIHEYGNNWGYNEFFITVMEKLQPLTIQTIKKLDPYDFLVLYEEVVFHKIDEQKIDDLVEKYREKVEDFEEFHEYYPDGVEHNNFYRVLSAIKNMGGGCSVDLHDENLMYRASTNTPVIIDPWAFYDTSDM
jgi:hypothetical protein